MKSQPRYQPMVDARLVLTRSGFAGGIKPAYDPAAIPEDSLWEARNVDTDEVGVLRLRPGSVRVAPSLGTGRPQGLTTYFGTLVLAWNRNLYKLQDGAWVLIRQAFLGDTSAEPVTFIPWARGGSPVLYCLAGNGLWEATATAANLVAPYTPQAGEPANLLRAADGSQDPTSGIFRARVGILRPAIQTRMAVAYGNDIYLSAPGDPSYWPATQVFHLPDNGDEVTALAVWYGALIIFRRRDIWAFFGGDVTSPDAALVLQADNAGCAAPRSVQAVPGVGLVFLGEDNVYALTGVTAIEKQVKAEPIGDDIVPYLRRAMLDGYADACSFYFDRQYYLSFPSAAEPERVFRLRTYPRRAWYCDTGPRAAAYTDWAGALYAADAFDGIVWKREGRTDDGAGIPWYVAFRHEALQPGPSKLRRLFVFTSSQETAQHIHATVIADGWDVQSVQLAVTAAAGADMQIGKSAIGAGRIGRMREVRVYEGRLGLRGHFAQVYISSKESNEDLGIIGYMLEYRPRTRPKGIRQEVATTSA